MKIYYKKNTGVKNCDFFGFDFKVENSTGRLFFDVLMYDDEQNARNNADPTNLRPVILPITTQQTLEDVALSLFNSGLHEFPSDTLNLSGAVPVE